MTASPGTDLAGGTDESLPDASGGTAAWIERYTGAVMGTYGTPQRVLVRGEGAVVWDADGRRYVDLLGGIATTVLGHAHPLLVSAVTSQLATLGHVSNFFATPVQVALAEQLLRVARAPRGSKVFFCNSGGEANEAALKIARRTGRLRVLAAEGGFHGRTFGALTLTHKAAYREPFAPLVPGVEHVPFGDVDALEHALRPTDAGAVAAVFLEPVQGEGGVVPAPPGYLASARRLTRAAGALLVLDEVQTGIGRTGAWFAHQLPGLGLGGDLPDVVTVAKSLGGGVPIGAAVAYGATADLLQPGQHGTTFGGNPVSAAAGLAVLHAIDRDGLLQNGSAMGDRLAHGTEALGHRLVAGTRGHGVLRGVVLDRPVAAAVVSGLLEAGVIANAVAPDVIRLAPPLVVTAAQVDEVLSVLPRVLDVAAAGSEEAAP